MSRLRFQLLVLLEEAKGSASMSHAELLVVKGNTTPTHSAGSWSLVYHSV